MAERPRWTTEAWTLIRFLHLLALAFFVGGQLLLVVAVVPAMRGAGDDSRMRAVGRRSPTASLVALGGADRHRHRAGLPLLPLGGRHPAAKLAVLVLVGVLTGLHIASPHSRAVSIAVLRLVPARRVARREHDALRRP